MGTIVRVERTHDIQTIIEVLSDKTIRNEISEDGVLPESLQLDTTKNCFLLVFDQQKVMGLYILHPVNSATLEIHANILPEYRKEFADESWKAALAWLKLRLPKSYIKLVAYIPTMFPNVYHFALKHGFKDEGKLTQAYRKNDEIHDIHIVGASIKELEAK